MNRLLARKIAYLLSSPFPLKRMQQWSKQKFIFPLYHLVSDSPSPLVKHLYPVASVDRFKRDIDYLLRHFEPATLDEVLDFAAHKTYSGKPKFFLTFDDGLAECYSVVRPILNENGLKAAFFINPAFIGNHTLAHRQKVSLLIESAKNNPDPALLINAGQVIGNSNAGLEDILDELRNCTIVDDNTISRIAEVYRADFDLALSKYKPYMQADQVKGLQDEGFVIGSHSYDHPEFNRISEEEMKEQVLKSFLFLDQTVGIKNRTFSFPFHDIEVPLSFYYFLQHEAGVQASFGTSGIKNDTAPLNLQRIPMEVKGFQDAASIIRAEYYYYLGKSLFRKNRIIRK